MIPTYKTVDTCAAEFAAETPYHYSTYEDESEVRPSDRQKVVILGSGPNRIGQGIEFDYCCVHASFALREAGLRDDHGQLQPRDGVDRLRHQRPAVLRAAHQGRRAQRHRRRAAVQGDRLARRADAAQAVGRDPGRTGRRHLAAVDRRRRRPQEVEPAVHRAQHPAASGRHGRRPRAGARDHRPDRLPGARAPELRARRAGDADRPRPQPPGAGDGRADAGSAASARKAGCRPSGPC